MDNSCIAENGVIKPYSSNFIEGSSFAIPHKIAIMINPQFRLIINKSIVRVDSLVFFIL